MQINCHTDNHIYSSQKLSIYAQEVIYKTLSPFRHQITSVDIHFSDQNSIKKSEKDKKCLISTKMNGMAPLIVTAEDKTIHSALETATKKLKRSIISKKEKNNLH